MKITWVVNKKRKGALFRFINSSNDVYQSSLILFHFVLDTVYKNGNPKRFYHFL